MRTEITPKDFKHLNQPIKNMIEETMHYIFDTYFKDKLKNNEYHNHKYFPLYLSLQKLLEEYNDEKY